MIKEKGQSPHSEFGGVCTELQHSSSTRRGIGSVWIKNKTLLFILFLMVIARFRFSAYPDYTSDKHPGLIASSKTQAT